MRSLAVLVALLTLLPAAPAAATELSDLLAGSREASYTAEQAIICATPDGIRDSVVRISQSGGDLRVAPAAADDVEVKAGHGGWVMSRQGGVVMSASIDEDEDQVEHLYVVEDLGDAQLMGRGAEAYRLIRDGVARAELVIDDETDVMVATTTFTEDGAVYCHRRFIEFDPTDPGFPEVSVEEGSEEAPRLELAEGAQTSLPETVAGFHRLDFYEDQLGFRFAYYSDGFFSFAVFETPSTVMLRDAVTVELGESTYRRSFNAGQATYVWEARKGGMALVGDLPPDLHEEVLDSLPEPDNPGFLRFLWRKLFG